MKLLKNFAILLLLISCQARITVNSNTAFDNYNRLIGLFESSTDYEETGIISQFIINRLGRADCLLEEIPCLSSEDDDLVESCAHLISRFYPERSRRIMFLTPFSPGLLSDNNEKIIEIRRVSFNIALMLELADILSRYEPQQFGVDIVFLAQGCSYSDESYRSTPYREFKENYQRPAPELAFLLKFYPGEELIIPIDYNSYLKSPAAVYDVWSRAYSRGWPEFDDSIEERPIDEEENILYETLNIVKLENRIDEDQLPEARQVKASFQRLGTLLMEIVDEKS